MPVSGVLSMFYRVLTCLALAGIISSAHADPPTLGKSLPDGSPVTLTGLIVTAVFSSGQVYLQKPDRSCGIRVDSLADFTQGSTAGITGVIKTDPATKERYIAPPPPDLGVGANLNGNRPFPADNPWNTPIDNEPVDPNSDTLIASIGLSTGLHPDFGADWNGGPFGIPYVVVTGTQPKLPVSFDYADESDPGPYPIPPNAPIEGGADADGDRHIIVIDRDNWKLYELFYSWPPGSGTPPRSTWEAGSGAIFDMSSNALRPAGWTSADAAGLPIFPGLVRYDEVVGLGKISHAIRFTAQRTRRAYVYPARHFASSDTSPSRPPMGMRVRLKASFDITPYPATARVILQAMKTYGMILADNGSNWYFSGAPDARWNDTDLNTLKNVKGSSFEVVKMGTIVTQ